MPLSRLPNATPFFPQLCAAPWFSLNRRARAPIGFTARRHSPPQGQKIGGPHIPAQSFRASITDRIVGHLGFLRENEVAGNGPDGRREPISQAVSNWSRNRSHGGRCPIDSQQFLRQIHIDVLVASAGKAEARIQGGCICV